MGSGEEVGTYIVLGGRKNLLDGDIDAEIVACISAYDHLNTLSGSRPRITAADRRRGRSQAVSPLTFEYRAKAPRTKPLAPGDIVKLRVSSTASSRQ